MLVRLDAVVDFVDVGLTSSGKESMVESQKTHMAHALEHLNLQEHLPFVLLSSRAYSLASDLPVIAGINSKVDSREGAAS